MPDIYVFLNITAGVILALGHTWRPSCIRSPIVLTSFAVVSIAAEDRLRAQQASAWLTVSANVTKNCTITTAPVNFGAYDPVAANATAPLDGIGTVTVACTKGAAAKVGLSVGGNATGTTRRMSGGATEYLTYELYEGTSRDTVWGDTTDTALDVPGGAEPEPAHLHRSTDAWLPAQDAAVGNYTDTVVATVNF